MTIQSMKRVELEISSDCNAACPGCARTQNLGKFGVYNHTLADIQSWLPTRDCIEDKIFKLCGVLGDPIVNPECLEITEYLVENGGHVHYSTNGGRQSADWWFKLGKLAAETDQVKVHFCVDGYKETNHIYRVNVVYKVVDRNMQAYSDGGASAGGEAEASWIYIVFDHNEHEVNEARELAEQLGFRFATRTGMRNSFHDWVSRTGKKNNQTKKTITTTGTKEPSKVAVVKELDQFITNEDKSPQQTLDIIQSIDCKYIHGGEIFVAANSTLWPCCFLWDNAFKNKENINTKYAEFPSDWNNLRVHSIGDILASDYYQTVLQDSWNPDHHLHMSRCIRSCAKNRAYQNEIKYAV